jgi:hypothetical protein
VTFLSPLAAILAGAIGTGVLLLLHVLRLRRQVVRVPTTMFWPGIREDLEVNTPFRRLRMSLLLLLQLLAVLLLAAALGEPVLDAGEPPAGRTIVLIDRSASMQVPVDPADPASPTRLEASIEAARVEIERRTASRGGREPGEVMLVAFDARPQVLCGFERRPAPLLEPLASIEPTDAEADLEAAARLASAFLVGGEDESGIAEVLLLSDGGAAAPERDGPVLLAGARLEIRSPVAAEASAANVGVASLSARRDDADPVNARLFVRLVNAGPRPVLVDVRFDRDETPVGTESLRIPAAVPDGPPGEVSIARDVDAPEASVLQASIVRITAEGGGDEPVDLLPADDAAAVLLPPASNPRIAIVAPDGRPAGALEALLEVMGAAGLRRMDAAAWTRLEAAGDFSELDLVVFDRVAGPRLPPVASLWFGARPPGIERVGDEADPAAGDGTGDASDGGGRRILSWRTAHPAMRFVALDEVAYAGFDAFREPPRSEVLARGPEGPVMLEVTDGGRRHVLVGFSLDRTNWTSDVGFAIFVQNVLTRNAATGGGQIGRAVRPGEPTRVRLEPGTPAGTPVRVTGPVSFTLPAGDGPDLLLPGLPLAGIYRVEPAAGADGIIAVNTASEVESDLRPRAVTAVRAREQRAGLVGTRAPRDLWPWFLTAAGVLATLEWLIYARRLRG